MDSVPALGPHPGPRYLGPGSPQPAPSPAAQPWHETPFTHHIKRLPQAHGCLSFRTDDKTGSLLWVHLSHLAGASLSVTGLTRRLAEPRLCSRAKEGEKINLVLVKTFQFSPKLFSSLSKNIISEEAVAIFFPALHSPTPPNRLLWYGHVTHLEEGTKAATSTNCSRSPWCTPFPNLAPAT